MSTGRVILMCGAAGSGKSTFARHLETQGFVRICYDELAWDMGYRRHPLSEDASNEVHQLIKNQLAAAVKRGEDVVVDSSFWSRASREEYRHYLRSLGIAPAIYYLDTPRDVILRRLAERRNLSGSDIVVPYELALRYIDGFQAPTQDEGELKIIKAQSET